LGISERLVIFSESTAAIMSAAKFDAFPSKRVAEVRSSIELLKGLQE
jgi:hypothetical protein